MPLLIYTLLRFGLTAILAYVFAVMGLGLFIGVLLGIIAAWCICYLFFNKLRKRAGENLRELVGKIKPRPTQTQVDDAAAEDGIDPNVRPTSR